MSDSETMTAVEPYLQSGLQSEAELGSMLDLQLRLTWPMELPTLRAIVPAEGPVRFLDVGCGQGGFTQRVAEEFNNATVLGVDLEQPNVDIAQQNAATSSAAARLDYERANAYDLSTIAHHGRFDFASCRSMLYTLPDVDRVVGSILRTLKPSGGVAHFLCEDYGAVFSAPMRDGVDHARFWAEGPCRLFPEPHMGRRIHTVAARAARALGLRAELRVTQLPISTQIDDAVGRETLAQVFESWKDYGSLVAQKTVITVDEHITTLDDIAAACRDPDGYVLWLCTVCEVHLLGPLDV